MKIGVAGYPVPAEIERGRQLEWTIDEAARLGVQLISGFVAPVSPAEPLRYDVERLRRLRGQAGERSVSIQPAVRKPFDLTGPDPDGAAAGLRASIQAAKVLGGPVMRIAYGGLKIETSRFNPQLPLAEHLAFLTENLRRAAAIAADEGVVLAIENHCDFSGRELAGVLAAVGSPAMRAALDTANALTVFCDPADDLAALAPYTVATHLKDMRVIQETQPGRTPFQAVGCALGEGFVDIPQTIRVLRRESPLGSDVPLQIELGWMPAEPGVERSETSRAAFDRSLRYLRDLLAREGW